MLMRLLLLLCLAVPAHAFTPSCYTAAPTKTPTITPTVTTIPTFTPTTGGAPALVGFVPDVDTSAGIAVSGTHAYTAAAAFGVAVADISNPSAPTFVGAQAPPGFGTLIATNGTLAALSSDTQGLSIVDVSNPAQPIRRSVRTGTIKGVAMAGNLVYAEQSSPSASLLVLDVTNPSAPNLIGSCALTQLGDMVLQSGFLYIISGAGMAIIDATVPTNPHTTSTTPIGGLAAFPRIAVSGSFAYIAAGANLLVYNVSNPAAPVSVTTFATAAGVIAIDGTRAFVISSTIFKIIDISTPASPVVTGFVNTGALGYTRLAVSGNLAYVIDGNTTDANNRRGLSVWNVAGTAPVYVSNVYNGFGGADIVTTGNLAIAASGTSQSGIALRIVNIATPSAPTILSSVPGYFATASVSGSFVYAVELIPSPSHFQFDSISISNPSAPSVVASIPLASGCSDSVVVGSFVYLSSGASIQIVNVSTPAAPAVLTTIALPSTARGMFLAGTRLYVADNTALLVMDVTAPSAPSIVGSLAATAATAVFVVGTEAYFIDGSNLRIADVTTTTPVPQSTSPAYGSLGVAVAGSRAYLATAAGPNFSAPGTMNVVNVANPFAPALLAQYPYPGTIFALTAAGGLAYGADDAATVVVAQ